MVPDHLVKVQVREWLPKLLYHRQPKIHFLAPAWSQEQHDLRRYHKLLIQERIQQIKQLQKVLETAKFNHSNLSSSISNACQQTSFVTTLTNTELAYTYKKVKLLELCQTLEGYMPTYQRLLTRSIIAHIDFLEHKIQNVQTAIKICALPLEKSTHLLNESSIVKQIDDYLSLSDINTNINCFAYDRHLTPRKRVCPGYQASSNRCISNTTRRHLILYKLAQVIVSDKDIVLAPFYHQAHSSRKKQSISTIAHKLLILSYHILKNNNFHHKFVFNHNKPRDAAPLSLEPYYGYRPGPLIINCCISICSMAGLALISHTPLVFPSLGTTAFLPFYKPTDPSSSPRNIIIGHTLATIIGYLSLVITGLTAAGPVLAVGVTLPRIFAIGLSLGLTIGLMVLLRAPHPPALATTLMISLGTVTKPWQLLVFILAIVLLTLQILIINRLAGMDYPLWRSQPIRTALKQCNQKS
jgi:hypothetical protein